MNRCGECNGELKGTDAWIYTGEGSNWMNEPELFKLIYQCSKCGILSTYVGERE